MKTIFELVTPRDEILYGDGYAQAVATLRQSLKKLSTAIAESIENDSNCLR